MSEYELLPSLTKAKISDYEALFLRVYGSTKKLSQDYLQWLYIDNPHGRVVGVDAFYNGTLAAHYAAIPRLYSANGVRHRILLSVNTATCPNHQRQGLFKRTASSTYDLAEDQGFAGIIGVANEQSIHAFISSLGFSELGNVDLVVGGWGSRLSSGDQAFKLADDSQWLSWRLSQPGSKYALTNASGSRRYRISKRVGFVNFDLEVADIVDITKLPPHYRYRWPLPFLRPSYPKPRGTVTLPRVLMPSPWHVIARPLRDNRFLSLCQDLQLNGLAMDTF